MHLLNPSLVVQIGRTAANEQNIVRRLSNHQLFVRLGICADRLLEDAKGEFFPYICPVPDEADEEVDRAGRSEEMLLVSGKNY